MGRSISHFSHPHALVLKPSTQVDTLNGVILCSFCRTRERTGKKVYACSCGYILDPTCARLKKQELVPAHKQHVLDLIADIPAPESIFCNVCGLSINNKRYRCTNGSTCDYDVHLWCTKLREKLDSKFHEHTLYLHIPDPQRHSSHGFRCGHCEKGDLGLCGYTCKVCQNGFFLHIGCVDALVPCEDLEELDPTDDLLEQLDGMQTQATYPPPPAAPQAAPTNVAKDQTSSDDDCDECCEELFTQAVCCCCSIS